jgi:hypothetical protein
MPISPVRRATEYAVIPYRPTAASSSETAEQFGETRDQALMSQQVFDLSVHRGQIEQGEVRIDPRKYTLDPARHIRRTTRDVQDNVADQVGAGPARLLLTSAISMRPRSSPPSHRL